MATSTANPEDMPPHLAGMSDAELSPTIRDFDVATLASRTTVVDKQGQLDITTRLTESLSKLPPLTALPPEARDAISEKIYQSAPHARADVERRLVREYLEQQSRAYRLKAGPGDGATPFQLEAWAIRREIEDLHAEWTRIDAELNETAGYDQRSGAALPRHPEGSYSHKQRLARIAEIGQGIADLDGHGGQKRLREAEAETAKQMRALATAQHIEIEAARRAEARELEAEIEARAELRANVNKNSL